MPQGYLDPLRSVRLLDELSGYGLTDEAFSKLHHFDTPVTVKSHRDYCLKTSAFLPNSTNALLQRRLECMLKAYWGGSFKSQSSQIWKDLASAVLAEIPHGSDV
jgi:hypothetical protein